MEVLKPTAAHEEVGRRKNMQHQRESAPAGEADAARLEQADVEVPPADEDISSIVTILFNDHDYIKGIYRRAAAPDSAEQREKLLNELLTELLTHMAAEEAVVYPAVAEQIEEHMRDHAMDEHESLKLFTADLKGMKAGQEGYEDKVHQLMETFLEHIYEEEHKMLPALRDTLTEAQLLELGKKFEQAKSQLQPSI